MDIQEPHPGLWEGNNFSLSHLRVEFLLEVRYHWLQFHHCHEPLWMMLVKAPGGLTAVGECGSAVYASLLVEIVDWQQEGLLLHGEGIQGGWTSCCQ